MRVRSILALTLLLSLSHAKGQDIHFSQYEMAPMNLNPALTGAFEGNYRFTGIHRTQWLSVTRPYSTFGISADARDLQGIEGLGSGLFAYHDVAGDSRLRTFQIGLSASWRFHPFEDSTHGFSIGLRPHFEQRSIDYEDLNFDNQYNGLYYDPSRSTGESFSRQQRSYLDAAIGLRYRWERGKREHYGAGISLYNLFKPRQSFYDAAWVQRDRRMSAFLSAEHPLNEEMIIKPSAFLGIQGSYRELVVGSDLEYILRDEWGLYRSIFAGLWYRNRDAGFVTLGMHYDEWRVGLSYDVNISDLRPASRGRGGFEITIRYILRSFERPDELYKSCPTFI